MKILLSCYSCQPDCGSEQGVGWAWMTGLAKTDDVTALTNISNRLLIEKGLPEGKKIAIKNESAFVDLVEYPIGRGLRILYVGAPRWLLKLRTRKLVPIHMVYLAWQYRAFKEFVRSGLRTDIVHHVTFGQYWTSSFLGLTGIPLVFGPVGGGDVSPEIFRYGYSLRGQISEIGKAVASFILPRLPGMRRTYRRMSCAIAATDQTARALRRLVTCPVSVVPQSGIRKEDFLWMQEIAEKAVVSKTPLFIVSSRFVHWKGVDLAVRAFAEALPRLPGNPKLILLGNGPEKKRVQKLVARLRLERWIEFAPRFPTRRGVYEKIAMCTALIHPALHEAFGQICLESLAVGTPVICWKHAGPALIVTENEGFPIDLKAKTREQAIGSMADAMEKLATNPELRKQMSLAALHRVETDFLWDKIIEKSTQCYPQE